MIEEKGKETISFAWVKQHWSILEKIVELQEKGVDIKAISEALLKEKKPLNRTPNKGTARGLRKR